MTDIINTTNPPTTRRAILVGAATAAAIPAAAALATVPIAGAASDAELLAKLARACDLCDRLNRPASDFGLDPEVEINDCPVRSEWENEEIALFHEVADMPVQTVAGALAKLRLTTRDGGAWGGGVRNMVPASGAIDQGDVAAQYAADVIAFLAAHVEGGR